MSEFAELIKEYIREKQASKDKEFSPAEWLDSASKRSSQLFVATHVLKFTHGDAKGTNVRINPKVSSLPYVTTESLKKIKNDVSVRNASALDIVGLLEIQSDGRTVFDYIEGNDNSIFASFTNSESQLQQWMNGFRSILLESEVKTHPLAKQIYFPTGKNQYHILSPLYASSLAQFLYDKVQESRYGEKMTQVREKRKKGEFGEEILVDYPDLAVQNFGGSNTQNISRLNNLRRGRVYLLKSLPPLWKTIKKPPLGKKSFWKIYEQRSYKELQRLKQYLILMKGEEGNKNFRDLRDAHIDQLLDLFLMTSFEIQTFEKGWSGQSELPLYEQIWLDPEREEIQQQKKDSFWKEALSVQFARWLIHKLAGSDLKFSDMNHKFLADKCLSLLKETA